MVSRGVWRLVKVSAWTLETMRHASCYKQSLTLVGHTYQPILLDIEDSMHRVCFLLKGKPSVLSNYIVNCRKALDVEWNDVEPVDCKSIFPRYFTSLCRILVWNGSADLEYLQHLCPSIIIIDQVFNISITKPQEIDTEAHPIVLRVVDGCKAKAPVLFSTLCGIQSKKDPSLNLSEANSIMDSLMTHL